MQRSNDEHLRWREIESRAVHDAMIFTVHTSTRSAPDGREADYTLVDSPDWCNVITPVRREDGVECLVLARQYRHGADSVTIGFPGGLVDEGEAPQTAARRELEEETGYTAHDKGRPGGSTRTSFSTSSSFPLVSSSISCRASFTCTP